MNPNIARLMLFKSDTLVNPAFLAIAHENSPYLSIYRQKQGFLSKMSNPVDLPAGNAYNTDFSNDGAYLGVTHESSPYLTLYKRNNSKFTKLSNPAALPPSASYGIDFSANGVYLAIGSTGSPYITIYKRNGDVFTKLSNPGTLPNGQLFTVKFSPDNVYLAVSGQNSPFTIVYKRTGDTFTALSSLGMSSEGTNYDCSWSNDGRYLAIACNNSPGFRVFKKSGDFFTMLPSPSTVPGVTCGAIAFSPDNNYLAVGASNGLHVYKRSGDTFIKLTSVTQSTAYIQGLSWSADGLYISCNTLASPYMLYYGRVVDTFSLLTNPNILPSGTARGSSFFPTGFNSTSTLLPDVGADILPAFSAGNTGVGTRYQQSYTAPEFMPTIQSRFTWSIRAYADYGYTFCNADVYRNGVAIYNGRVGGGPTLGGNGTWYRDYSGTRGGTFDFAINAGDTITATLYIGTRDSNRYTPNHDQLSCSTVRTS